MSPASSDPLWSPPSFPHPLTRGNFSDATLLHLGRGWPRARTHLAAKAGISGGTDTSRWVLKGYDLSEQDFEEVMSVVRVRNN